MKEVTRREYYLFSPWLRIFHWIMVACIVTLFATGLMITSPWIIFSFEPTTSGMTVDNIRNIHFLAAYIFCAAFVLRIYGFITNPGDRLFPHVWKGYFYENTVDVALHYMFLKKEHASYLRNPLARCSYAFLYVLVFVEVLTGFGMYYMTNPSGIGGALFGWVITILGGEYMAHLVHHYVAWAIILFAIGHLYMVIRAEFMEGESEVSSMFSGSKILAHEPRDAGHLDGTLD
ncbi:MAG: Ni/Fe-hydrogenase, b-type cytochrome subunit [Selenomonadaceae bacterium]|nr:Ni/Fe-hydrogenase, b-type cytochrome subunit [Selenomonadaceae bacterium]